LYDVCSLSREYSFEYAVLSEIINLSNCSGLDSEIIKEIYTETNKTISRKGLYSIRQQIKKESFHSYKTMREGQYEYIHEFKERINEILSLQVFRLKEEESRIRYPVSVET
jgi:hypothetical protein